MAAVVWLLLVLTGSLLMAQYSQRVGAVGTPPEQWLTTSLVPRESGLPKLVMFVHPRCPCSRATLGELEKLMARCQGLVNTQVLFIQPKGVAEDWARTDLWHTAASIPGVKVSLDPEGEEARRFEAETSGQTLLYDAGGRLMFQGGITLGRGHAGDNAGSDAIESLLKQNTTVPARAPVYGCALGGKKTTEKCTSCQP